MRRALKALTSTAAAAALALVLCLGAPAEAKNAPQLPAPYVSRALDAVVIPIDQAVRKAFKLKKKDRGVLVLAVMPKGVAARNGIRAGDVLRSIKGYRITKATDVDAIVYYWITQNLFDFSFDFGRGGAYTYYTWPVTRDDYSYVIDTTTISTWESWSVETYSFSYTEYYESYSSEIVESYSTSETIVEQEVSSQSFVEEVTTSAADSDNDGTPDGYEAIQQEDQALETSTEDSGGSDDAGVTGDDGNTGTGETEAEPPDEQPADSGANDQPADDIAAGQQDDGGSDQQPADDGAEPPQDDGSAGEPPPGDGADQQPVDDGAAEPPAEDQGSYDQPADDGGDQQSYEQPADEGGGDQGASDSGDSGDSGEALVEE